MTTITTTIRIPNRLMLSPPNTIISLAIPCKRFVKFFELRLTVSLARRAAIVVTADNPTVGLDACLALATVISQMFLGLPASSVLVFLRLNRCRPVACFKQPQHTFSSYTV